MPIYEYICEKCGNEFEMLVFKEDEAACSACGAKNPKKNLTIGEEPPRGLNSRKRSAAINAPNTNAMISGRIY